MFQSDNSDDRGRCNFCIQGFIWKIFFYVCGMGELDVHTDKLTYQVLYCNF